MLTEVTTAKNALEGFATSVEAFWSGGSFETHITGGWNTVPMNTSDMSARIRALAVRLEDLPDDDIDPALKNKLSLLPERLAWFQNNTLPQLTSGNLTVVLSIFEVLLSNVEQNLPASRLPAWSEVAKSDLVPRELGRKIRTLEAAVDSAAPRLAGLDEKVRAITDAHTAAMNLPTDMASLREARDEIDSYTAQGRELLRELQELNTRSNLIHADMTAHGAAAEKQMENIDAAYSAATTTGLAASFSERADALSKSVTNWVFALFFVLVLGAVIGYVRLESFQALAANGKADHQILWVSAAMSIVSVAAPVWFAWLATRQIGQRFRLAEDYAFKASVARAYEGYRKEAARVDKQLEARLFASALDRLDEAPLRFISTEEHGSPYESLFASAGFQKMLEKLPSLRGVLSDALDRAKAPEAKPRARKSAADAAGD